MSAEPPPPAPGRPAVRVRLLALGVVLLGGLTAAGLGSAAAARGARRPHRAPPPARLVEVRPTIARYPAAGLGVVRAGAVGRALLGVALVLGAIVHLRRAARVRLGATAAALAVSVWALGSAVERGLRPAEAAWLSLRIAGEPVALTPWELGLGAGLLIAVGVGVAGALARRGLAAGTADAAGAPSAAGP